MSKTKAKQQPLSGLISRLVPDRLEEAYDAVETYLGARARLPGEQAARLAETVGELIDRFGGSVQAVLYDLLCNKGSALRKTTEGALSNGVKAAVGVLVPLLVAQFALAPAVAVVVATLVVKVIATKGEQALCEELAKRARAQAKARAKATRRPARPHRSTPKQGAAAQRSSGRASPKKQVSRTKRKATKEESG